ncbi:MAG TPA: ABC transporter permease [Bryobacteraceae bacterium]|nr:ABC transporter permease [Bryobacteraceae bacterium]
MNWLLQDLRYGLRSLRRSPAFTAISILALVLGIGSNSAVFSVVNAVLLRPLGYKDPDRLVVLWESKATKDLRQQWVSPADFKDFAEQSTVFDGMGAIRAQPAVVTGGEMPERVAAARVSPSVFELLGMKPSLGRSFALNEDQAGKNQVAVLSAGLWQRRFGADRNILGNPLLLDGRAYTIIGVAPPEFQLPNTPTDLWIPYTPDPKDLTPANRAVRFLKVIARLKPGITLDRAQQEMRGIARVLEREYADSNAGYSVDLRRLDEQLIGNIRPTLWTLLAAVGCVLLISCANVALLLLARAAAREREMAVRTALGANSTRLLRQLLTESVLLAGMGGIFGLALASLAVASLSKLASASIPRANEISIDWRVLAFTASVALVTGVIFGLAPALALARSDLNSVLKANGRSSTSNRARGHMRDAFVVCEIAACVVLLIAAGLLLRSFARLERVNPGFQTDHVLTMQLALPEARYSGIQIGLFYQLLLERVQGLPDVGASGICRFLPLSNSDASLNFQIQGQPVRNTDQPRAKFRAASAGYFTALRIPLLEGRLFDSSDGQHTPKVVIINQAAARRFWPGENPLGKRILSGLDDSEWSMIIGVVGDVKHAGLDADAEPETYYHYLQIPPHWMNFAEATTSLAIRTSSDPRGIISPLRREVRGLDPDLPLFNVRTMQELVQGSVAQVRLRTFLLALFAGLGLVLALVGLYGVISYSVTQRTQELGVRSALGAQPRDLLQLVVGHGMRLALFGVGIGAALALVGTRIISKLLFNVAAVDPITFGVTCLGMLGAAVAASAVPAWRATRVDPANALRDE